MNRMNCVTIGILGVFCLLTSGCDGVNKPLEKSEFEKVNLGMSDKQVEEILGPGKSVSKSDVETALGSGHQLSGNCDKWLRYGVDGGTIGFVGLDRGKVVAMILQSVGQ